MHAVLSRGWKLLLKQAICLKSNPGGLEITETISPRRFRQTRVSQSKATIQILINCRMNKKKSSANFKENA